MTDQSSLATPEERSAAREPVLAPAQYDELLRLADEFDAAGEELRRRAGLGPAVLGDPSVSETAELSPHTWRRAEEDVRAATTGRHGLLDRSVELDADALVVRATVQTYRWIDELAEAAYRTLGSIAARAIGYLAPQVALGGAIVSAGLIETDALDRDEVASYLNELAESNPELMDHVTSGGGGLLDGLQMRSLLTAGVLAGDRGPLAARGGLRAIGVDELETGFSGALRDVAGGLLAEPGTPARAEVVPVDERPRGLGGLMDALRAARDGVVVQRVSDERAIAFLPGPGGSGRLRLVSGDRTPYATTVVQALEDAAAGRDRPLRVMLVGWGHGGVAASEIAASAGSSAASSAASSAFTIEQVVTAGAPAAQAAQVPPTTHVLALEDRSDPVVLLGSLVNAGAPHRVTVVFEGGEGAADLAVYARGGHAADAAGHPELRAALARLEELGYLQP